MTIFRYKTLNPIVALPVVLGDGLFDVVQRLAPEGKIYHFLENVPEQYEDFYVVLIDDSLVLSFGIDRDDGALREVEKIHVETYRRGLRGVSAKSFKVTLEAARDELKRLG